MTSAVALIEDEEGHEQPLEAPTSCQHQKKKSRVQIIIVVDPAFKEDLRKLAAHHGFGNNMSGVVRKILRDECKKAGIKPWPGRKTQFELT